MKKLILWAGCMAGLLLAACSSAEDRKSGSLETIPVADAFGNLQPLKVSDFLGSIRYVALETNDSVLVGEGAHIGLLPDYILVTDEKQALLFDKNDGHFVCKLGHYGNDPSGYASSKVWFQGHDGVVCFRGWKDEWLRYDLQGQFQGMLKMSENAACASVSLLASEEGYIQYFNNGLVDGKEGLVWYTSEPRQEGDTLLLAQGKPVNMSDIKSIGVFKSMPCHFTQKGMFYIVSNQDQSNVVLTNPPVLWQEGEQIRFMRYRNDTVYTVDKYRLTPAYWFDMGNLSVTKMKEEDASKALVLGKVDELENSIFFECFDALVEEDHLYYGVYNRRKGTVVMGRRTDKIMDDLTPFMPVDFSERTNAHELAGMIEAADVLEWVEEHESCKDNPELGFLKTLKEDDNPVVVIARE